MKFRFAAPFDRFFQLLGDNFGLFFGVGLVGLALPALGLHFGLMSMFGIPLQTLGESLRGLSVINGMWGVGAALLMSILNLINLSMVTEFAILRAVNKPVSIGTALNNALTNILPLIGISLYVGFIVLGGLILLIVPGIIWSLATMVAVPAYVAQRGLGVGGSVSKAFELTRNHRWTLFLVCLAAFVVIFIVAFGLAYGGEKIMNTTIAKIVEGAGIVGDSALTVLCNVFITAIYITLRESKDKKTPNDAAAVFE